MSAEEGRISLKIDVNTGTIELDAPVDSFEHAIAKTKELTDSLDLRRGNQPNVVQAPEKQTVADSPPANTVGSQRERSRGRSSKASASTGRSGRLGSFKPVHDLLSEEQQVEIRRFMEEKRPEEQADKVQVAIFKGEELLERQGFNYNEVYTLLWRAGVDPLPKAVDVVIQKLMQEQMVEKGEHGFFLKFLGRNRVEKELPEPLSKDTK